MVTKVRDQRAFTVNLSQQSVQGVGSHQDVVDLEVPDSVGPMHSSAAAMVASSLESLSTPSIDIGNRRRRVEEIKAAIQDGTYQLSSYELAAAMLRQAGAGAPELQDLSKLYGDDKQS